MWNKKKGFKKCSDQTMKILKTDSYYFCRNHMNVTTVLGSMAVSIESFVY